MDPHEVLGVSPDASDEEVRSAYRTLVRRHHPDRHVGEPPEVQRAEADRMAEVSGAFHLLQDPAALARWKANHARVGRAPGARHPRQATTPRPPSRLSDNFDYRRAASSEFSDDVTGGRWGRTPSSPPRPAGPAPGRAGRTRPRQSLVARLLNAAAWLVLLGLVVGAWVLATDSGRRAWESVQGSALVDVGTATAPAEPGLQA